MKIGIDISQTAHKGTGVALYVTELVTHLLKIDQKNEYILFFSSLRQEVPAEMKNLYNRHKNVTIKHASLPPTALDILWNKLHIIPIEQFVGNVDVFLTSDWTEPPARHTKKITILYDLIVFKYPQETSKKIIDSQKRKLRWVLKESSQILCISEATKQDAQNILGIEEKKLKVIHAGI